MLTKGWNKKKKSNKCLSCKTGDEWYTSYNDIENEVFLYKKSFKNKVIFCNCDDPEYSNFYLFFKKNFFKLKLKKLICTHYENGKKSYAIVFSNKNEEKKEFKTSDGDFRSSECQEYLKQADIVCTNPPFSLFNEYMKNLIENKKKFLILGDQNKISNPFLFNEWKNNHLWSGCDNGKIKWFRVPNDYQISSKQRIKIENGEKYLSMGRIVWFTNIKPDREKKTEIKYCENFSKFNKFKNYDALEIPTPTNKNVPKDYKGEFGMPITFFIVCDSKKFNIIKKINVKSTDGKAKARVIISNK